MQDVEMYRFFGIIPVLVHSDTGLWEAGGPTPIERRINDALITATLIICRTFQWSVTLTRVNDE